MERMTMNRWFGWSVFAAMAMAGCECNPNPPPAEDCSSTTVAFESPASGATVDSPFSAAINVKTADGGAFFFDSATISVGGQSTAGTVNGNRATFAGLSASPGAQTLTATIVQGTCSKSATRPVTVRALCTDPAVTAISFPQDTGTPLGVLNRTELPVGTALTVKVDATCTEGVQVRIKRGTDVVGELTDFTNGSATVTLPTLPDADVAQYDLFAELVKGGTALNTSSTPGATATIQVSRAVPGCQLTTSGTFGPGDDADTSLDGFQMRVNGLMAIGSTGIMTVQGLTPVNVTPSSTGDVSADFTMTASGTYTAMLTCVDDDGNSNQATASFTLDFDAPSISIVSPASVDGGPAVVTRSPAEVQVATVGAEDGSLIEVFRNGASVATGTVTGGMATLAVPFGIDGTYTLAIHVTDLAGNEGQTSVSVVVTLDGCGAIFSRPGACPALVTASQAVGGNYNFQLTSKASCANQPVALYRSEILVDGGVIGPAEVSAAVVGGTGVTNFAPLAVTSGQYLFQGSVTNIGDDAGVSDATCAVTIDLDGPAMTSPALVSPATSVTLNAAQDSQPGTPGVQRLLSFSARVPVGGQVDVCTTQAVDPVTSMARTTSLECGDGWYVLQRAVTSPVAGFTFPEGSYQLKVVVVGGGLSSAPTSAPVPLLVDATLPCVSGLTRSLPQDTNMDGRLNIAELNGEAPRLQFTLGCGDNSTATLAAMSPVVVRDIVGGVASTIRPTTAMFAAGVYTLTLTGSYTTEVNLNLFVELTDLAGNKNTLAAMGDPATFQLRVDPVVPACDIISPNASTTLVGQAGAPGGMFAVQVSTSADVGTNGVRVTFGSSGPVDLTPATNVAQTSFAVTGTNTHAVNATCFDQAGNSTTATTRSVLIDLDAPTCAITAPTATTYSVNQIATSITVGGAEGEPVTVRSDLQVAPLSSSLIVTGGSASGTLTFPNGTQTITATVDDPAGNTCTATVANVVVNSTACSFTLSNVVTNAAGNWFNRSNTGSLGATSGTIASVDANSADCQSGQTVTLQRTAPTPGAISTSTTAINGNVSFASVAVNDGETWAVTIDNGAGILTTQTFRVGLVVPTATGVTVNGNTVTSGQDLFFVAATGNINLESAAGTPKVTTYFADTAAGTAGSQTNVIIAGVSGTVFGTDHGTVEVHYGATVISSLSVSAEPYTSPTTSITLSHGTTGTFVVRLTSAAGNSTDVISNNAAVDVIAPAAPSVTQTLTAARTATVGLAWNPVYDDDADSGSGGLTGGPVSQLAGYDVRWTTSSVVSNNAMASEADFYGSSSNQDGITSWSASAINKSLTVPPINTYYIAVRARDEVGNYSTFAAPAAVANTWTVTTLSAPVASTAFGTSFLGARLIGNDSTADLVVTAPSVANGGAVYVYDSSILGASQATCGAGCQTLLPSDTTAGSFGADISVAGNVGDVAGEALPDLVVGQNWTANGFGGRAVIFFGTTAATLSTANSIELRGDTTNRIGLTTQIIKDISGDGLDELALAAPTYSSNRGRVFIYRGRTQAAWAALRTATDGVSGVPYVPVSSATADYVIDGPTPLLVSPAGNAFGQNRRGFISVNDLDGDTFPDVAIPMSRGSINRYRIFGSASIAASTGAAPLDSTAGFRWEITETTIADNANTSGLGASALGNADYLGSSAADLIVAYPGAGSNGQVQLFSALLAPTNPTLNTAPTTRILGPLTFGTMVSAGLFDGDSYPDLVTATNQATANFAWVLYQNQGTFESGTVGTAVQFWISSFDAAALTGTAASKLGAVNWIGDITGDGQPELLLGDTNAGQVQIWR